MEDNELITSRAGRLGWIRLNRPRALNSLTFDMAGGFARALDNFAADDDVYAVLVTGEGERGLCAGGDIRALHELHGAQRGAFKQFWRAEYELDARIAGFPKRYIAVMDGVVMGGGVGISAHGNRRIVTERTRLAMPETSIGFIPDAGGTWLLSRAGGAGIYLALSGASIGGADAIALGLADILIDSADISALRRELAGISAPEDADRIFMAFARAPGPAMLDQHKLLLDAAMKHDRIDSVLAALDAEDSEFAHRAAASIRRNSPTSLRLTHALLERAARAARLEECLTNEFRAACALLGAHDLYEGIRAAIIDKDKAPRWSPPTLEGIENRVIDALLAGTGDPDPQYRAWPRAAQSRLEFLAPPTVGGCS